MSELKSVAAFFIGLVVFVIIIALAIGRLRPSRQKETIIPSPTPTVAQEVNDEDRPSILERIRGIFRRNTPTPTSPSPTPIRRRSTPTPTRTATGLKEAFRPTFVVSEEEVDLSTRPINNVVVIPETGTPNLLLPLTLLFSSFGFWLKKKK
jgi:hypothetical protein